MREEGSKDRLYRLSTETTETTISVNLDFLDPSQNLVQEILSGPDESIHATVSRLGVCDGSPESQYLVQAEP